MQEFIQAIWMSLTVFILVFILSRVVGRKLLSQMTYFDFVIAIIMGTIAGAFVVNEVEGVWVLLSPVIITITGLLTSYISLKNLKARKILEGEPVVVIQNGKVMEKNMSRLRYTIDDLEMQLRDKNAFNITEVEFAVLEPHGQLSVLKKAQSQTVTMSDIDKIAPYKGMATEIIKDGDIIGQNLWQTNLDLAWLKDKLKQQGINDPSQVFYAALQPDGTLYVDRRSDELTYVQRAED